MELTNELNTEQIVTNILTSHEILKRKKGDFCISSPSDLGEFLSNLPPEELVPATTNNENTKYTFIKEDLWKF